MKILPRSFCLAFAAGLLFFAAVASAALIDQVNQAFREVYGRNPTTAEWEYWAGRVTRGEKTSYTDLVGAMAYQKLHGGSGSTSTGTSAPSTTSVAAASTFQTDRSRYPSSINPNYLPDGTLIKSAAQPQVYVLRGGKRSWVISSIIDTWLSDSHYFDRDVITVVPDADLARYPQTTSVNSFYIGKILRHPDGRQFFIDDKLRKRPISASVRSALKYPSRNLYPVTSVHLNEFTTGLAVTRTNIHPAGTVMYNGPYHGGTIWRLAENASGTLTKRLYLQDYLYETEGYPWSGQILPVSDTELARYARGPNIERYPDGWVVGLDQKRYVVQKGVLRHLASPSIFDAMGYKSKYVLTVFPEFLRKYPQGTAISAFKSLVAGSSATTTTTSTATSPASTASSYPDNLVELRPEARELIKQVNTLYLTIFDQQITSSENKFWVDYIYQGDAQTKAELVAALETSRRTGTHPAFTPRNQTLDSALLKSRWFPYAFYYVWHKTPSPEAVSYWYARIDSGNPSTIEGLLNSIGWLKTQAGLTHK